MKKSTGHSIAAAIEWSVGQATAYEPIAKRAVAAATIGELGMVPSNGSGCIVAASRRTVFLKPTRVPNAGDAEIRQVVQGQLGQLFPVNAHGLAYDLWLTGNVTSEGRLAMVCAIPSEALRALTGQLGQAGLRAVKVIPAALGSVLMARSMGLKDCTVCEITSEGVAIDIVVDGDLRWSRVVPTTPSDQELEAEIERTHAVSGLPRAALVAAGGVDLPQAQHHANTTTLQMLATAPAHSLNVHLELPEAVAVRRSQRSARRMSQALIAAAVAALAWVKVGLDLSDSSAQRAAGEESWRSSISKLQVVQKTSQTRRKRAEGIDAALRQAFKPAQSFSDVLAVLSNAAPPSAWLSGMTFERGKPLIMRGTSLSSDVVAEYLGKLSSDPRFRDVRLVFANNAVIETTPVVQFSMSMHVIGNLPLAETDKDKRKR